MFQHTVVKLTVVAPPCLPLFRICTLGSIIAPTMYIAASLQYIRITHLRTYAQTRVQLSWSDLLEGASAVAPVGACVVWIELRPWKIGFYATAEGLLLACSSLATAQGQTGFSGWGKRKNRVEEDKEEEEKMKKKGRRRKLVCYRLVCTYPTSSFARFGVSHCYGIILQRCLETVNWLSGFSFSGGSNWGCVV